MKKRCLNCMKEYESQAVENEICPHCGFEENTPPRIKNHLYPGMILKNRYVIGTVVGAGGFGVVYKAWDKTLDILVAIKEYFPTYMVQRTPGEYEVYVVSSKKQGEYIKGKKRFLDEARTLAAFKEHPNIVDVESYFEENNTAYFVMEFLEGETLQEYIKRVKVIKPDKIQNYFRPVMSALKAMHKEGVIHRDINPKNIYICKEGVIKIIDFGAARLSFDENRYTQQLTRKYAPVEQYDSKSEQSFFTDVYALGATMYEALTGKAPEESTVRASNDTVKSPRSINSSIPEYLSNAVMKAIAVKKELRFQNIDDFEKAIIGTKVVDDPQKENARKILKRNIIITSIAIAILTFTVFFLRWFFDRKSETEIKNASVTVWIPYEGTDEENAVQAEEIVNNMSSGFLETYGKRNIEIHVETIPSDIYVTRLNEVKGTDKMPDLFLYPEGYSGAEEILNYVIEPENVFEYLSEADVYYLFDYKDRIIKSKKIPTGFEAGVVFVRRTDLADDIEALTINSIDDIIAGNEKMFYADLDYVDISADNLGVDADALKTDSIDDEEGLNSFENGELIYYLASTNEFRSISSRMPGMFEMRPYQVDKTYGYFTDYWCISSSASKAEKNAAEALLSYFLTQSAQDEYHITEKNSIPLNKDSYNDFISLNPKYNIISEYYLDKMVLVIN